jgi:hypothetical protein
MQEEFAMEITVPILSEQDRHEQRRSPVSAMHFTPSWNGGA